MNSKKQFIRILDRGFRAILISLLALSFLTTSPTHAAGQPNLELFSIVLNGGNLVPLETGRTFTITVKNVGDVSTTGPATVVFSHTAGLTVTAIGGTDWNCTLGTLTCTRPDFLDSQASYPVITVTVNVLVSAPPEITSQAVVSGGGADDDPDNNTKSTISNVNAKADLIITGYELRNADKSAVIIKPEPNEIFWVRMTIQNQGGVGTSNFYPGVFLDDKPNYGPDHDSAGIALPPGYPVTLTLGETVDYQGYKVTGSNAQNGAGCVYYDPENLINPANTTVLTERGNYHPVSFLPGLAAGSSSTFDIEIAYPSSPYGDPIYDGIRTGLPGGSYKLFLYADTNCLVSEVTETNNVYPYPQPQSGPVIVNVGTDIDISIGGTNQGHYLLGSQTSDRKNYAGINAGPSKVTSNVPILASTRVLFGAVSYSEMMGYPSDQLTNEYVFPYYNNTAMDSQLRVSNLGGVSTTINVYVGASPTPIDTYTLAAGAATRKNYAGVNNGPLRVTSSATNIISTIRVLYGGLSYSELIGFPANQLTNAYIFPYYNNTAMDSQLRVSNMGGSTTTINVYVGSNPTPIDTYTLAAGAATRKNYAGVNNGPLRVTSSTTNILTTIRVIFSPLSYSELLGFPVNQLTTAYTYPVYNNVTADSQLRVSNVGIATTTITVYSGSTQIDSYDLAAGAATRTNYAGVNNGPLRVVSSSQPILTTIRMLYYTETFSSFYEMTGMPDNQLHTEYVFPWYNNTAMDSQIRFAVP